jgi:tRNA-Thr(GGU) m(6)t(6)A37 methyltransferase TsaA
MEPIGILRTPYAGKKDCPIQPRFAEKASGRVEVFDRYADGLQDIETFTHLILLYQFDRADEVKLVRPTFLDDAPHGIYASRHPCRPNGIGLSIVRLVAREGTTLIVDGVDMLDRTPLLDIKPYLPQYDAIPDAGRGWTAGKPERAKPAGRE